MQVKTGLNSSSLQAQVSRRATLPIGKVWLLLVVALITIVLVVLRWLLLLLLLLTSLEITATLREVAILVITTFIATYIEKPRYTISSTHSTCPYLAWEHQSELALDPQRARHRHLGRHPQHPPVHRVCRHSRGSHRYTASDRHIELVVRLGQHRSWNTCRVDSRSLLKAEVIG
jgi:hypothetical protein